ncbi:hypothetical protein [Acinetobacter modestus]|uniref:hypothetical protein n=1 Tax=Acinetobacter modestus TaxID=1776740 RepID=UPI001F4BCB97|nr:hypothetical protein [Acinetobacter modestus]MCH7329651.1 hypothetical protein [Acinetobacter modestus]
MALKLLLTVDLNAVNTSQRDAFYKFLEGKGLKKTNLTTTWTASFTESTVYSNAVETIKNILSSAAKEAKISNYEAQMMISANSVVSVRK